MSFLTNTRWRVARAQPRSSGAAAMSVTEANSTIPAAPPKVTLADDLRLVIRAFAHRWRMFLGIIVAFVFAGLLYIWFATPGFQSTVEILVDPRARNVVEGEVTPSGLGSSSFGADTALVDSQVGIITSRSVLGALI